MRTAGAGVSGPPRNFPTFPIQQVAHEETVPALIEQCSGVCFGNLTVNECLLSAISGRPARSRCRHFERLLSEKRSFARLLPKPQPAAHFYELGLVEDGVKQIVLLDHFQGERHVIQTWILDSLL